LYDVNHDLLKLKHFSQARTVSEIKHIASGLAIGVLRHLRGMVVNDMPIFSVVLITHSILRSFEFNEVGWRGRVEGGKHESFFFSL